MPLSEFAILLRQFRERAGLTQEELAERANLSRNAISLLELGERRAPKADTVDKIVAGLALGDEDGAALRAGIPRGKASPRTHPQAAVALPPPRCRALWGRDQFSREVEATLCDESIAQPILLLAAFGGYGKSEFARAVGERLLGAQMFRTAVWIDLQFEELQFTYDALTTRASTVQTTSGILQEVMSRLKVTSQAELAAFVQTEAVLLVIDSLENVPATERESLLSALHQLLGRGKSRAIITSRVRISTPYIAVYQVPGIEFDAALDLLRDETHFLRDRLATRSTTGQDLREIWQLTRGMPLALHLVAQRLAYSEIDAVLTELRQARSIGSDAAFYRYLGHHAWAELDAPARALLVFITVTTRSPQSFSQLSGLALHNTGTLGTPALSQALGDLLRWFALERSTADDQIVYTLHPVMRAFVLSNSVRQQWRADGITEEQLFEVAFRQHVRHLSSPNAEEGTTSTEYDTILRAMPDYLRCMGYFLANNEPKRVLWYWEQLSLPLWRHGRYTDYIACDLDGASAADQLVTTDPTYRSTRARIADELAYAFMTLGDFASAATHLQRAETLWQELGDSAAIVRVLRYRAEWHQRQGDLDAARRFCLEALAVATTTAAEQGPPIPTYAIQSLLGRISLDQGERVAAHRELRKARWAARQLDHDATYWSIGPTLNLARLHALQGHERQAAAYYRGALRATEDRQNPNLRAVALLGLAELLHEQRFADEAIEIYVNLRLWKEEAQARQVSQALSSKR